MRALIRQTPRRLTADKIMRRYLRALVLLPMVVTIGCGTIANCSRIGYSLPDQITSNTVDAEKVGRPPYQVYGGVRADLGMCPHLLDLPFSFAADTLTLPVTIPYSLCRFVAKPAQVPDARNPRQDLTKEDEPAP
jgi:uncharacterized protein YceK